MIIIVFWKRIIDRKSEKVCLYDIIKNRFGLHVVKSKRSRISPTPPSMCPQTHKFTGIYFFTQPKALKNHKKHLLFPHNYKILIQENPPGGNEC